MSAEPAIPAPANHAYKTQPWPQLPPLLPQCPKNTPPSEPTTQPRRRGSEPDATPPHLALSSPWAALQHRLPAHPTRNLSTRGLALARCTSDRNPGAHQTKIPRRAPPPPPRACAAWLLARPPACFPGEGAQRPCTRGGGAASADSDCLGQRVEEGGCIAVRGPAGILEAFFFAALLFLSRSATRCGCGAARITCSLHRPAIDRTTPPSYIDGGGGRPCGPATPARIPVAVERRSRPARAPSRPGCVLCISPLRAPRWTLSALMYCLPSIGVSPVQCIACARRGAVWCARLLNRRIAAR